MIAKYIQILALAIAFVATTACDGEATAAAAGATSSKLSKEERKAVRKEIRVLSKKLRKVMRADKTFKLSAECQKLGDEVGESYSKLRDARSNHPKLKEISQQSAAAEKKLQDAIIDKDEAARQKWAPIVAGYFQKKQEAMNSIPELKAMDQRHQELDQRFNAMQIKEQNRIPGVKELRDQINALQQKLAH